VVLGMLRCSLLRGVERVSVTVGGAGALFDNSGSNGFANAGIMIGTWRGSLGEIDGAGAGSVPCDGGLRIWKFAILTDRSLDLDCLRGPFSRMLELERLVQKPRKFEIDPLLCWPIDAGVSGSLFSSGEGGSKCELRNRELRRREGEADLEVLRR
jgi:hypothetical protein